MFFLLIESQICTDCFLTSENSYFMYLVQFSSYFRWRDTFYAIITSPEEPEQSFKNTSVMMLVSSLTPFKADDITYCLQWDILVVLKCYSKVSIVITEIKKHDHRKTVTLRQRHISWLSFWAFITFTHLFFQQLLFLKL